MVCARSKASHHSPTGLFRPLPIPSHPWSHIMVDFFTELPPSNRHTVILTIVDRFSKMVPYVLLAKLPSATETANLLALHIFQLHGLHISGLAGFLQGVRYNMQHDIHLQSNRQTERVNLSTVYRLGIPPPVPPSSPGWNTHTAPFPVQLQI